MVSHWNQELRGYISQLGEESFSGEINMHSNTIIFHKNKIKEGGKLKFMHKRAMGIHQDALDAFEKIPQGKGIRAAKKKAKELSRQANLFSRNMPYES